MNTETTTTSYANNQKEVLDSFVWVKLKNPASFSIIVETLTRIGLPAYNKNGAPIDKKELIQSCHILHKAGRYAIVHFKEMFMLNGRQTEMHEEDYLRRNAIIQCLANWDLVTPENPDDIKDQISPDRYKIIPHSDKKNWKLVSKYNADRSKYRRRNENDIPAAA